MLVFQGLSSNIYGEPYTNGSSVESSEIYLLFTDPTDFITNPFILLLTGVIGFAVIGLALVTKSDMITLGLVFVALATAGVIPIGILYNLIYADAKALVCGGVLLNCDVTWAVILTAIPVGSLTVLYVMTCVEWWTQRPAT